MTLDPYFHVKDDAYCYPDSNVLRNLLGVSDYDALVSAEGRLTVTAVIQLDADPVKGRFDTDFVSGKSEKTNNLDDPCWKQTDQGTRTRERM